MTLKCKHKIRECTGVSNATTDWHCKECGKLWSEKKDLHARSENQENNGELPRVEKAKQA